MATPKHQLTILAISDTVDDVIYSGRLGERFGGVDLVISCGDLPASYLDFVVSTLDVPLYGVRGNHDHGPAYAAAAPGSLIAGAVDLHGRAVRSHGLLLAGFGGSPRYNAGPEQYTEAEMRLLAARLAPRLILNKLRYGRFLDILVTHSPPLGIHDERDRCHQGFETFRRFLRTFRPRYHLHGHLHVYDRRTVTRTRFEETTVLNVYGYRALRIDLPLPTATLPALRRGI